MHHGAGSTPVHSALRAFSSACAGFPYTTHQQRARTQE
jgi:hypothetical protein